MGMVGLVWKRKGCTCERLGRDYTRFAACRMRVAESSTVTGDRRLDGGRNTPFS